METSNKSETRRSQQQRRDEAESGLLNAAVELIAEQGITKTSLAQIGERAGYSRGLVNYHFRSKDALIDKLINRCQKYFVDVLDVAHADNGLETVLGSVDKYIQLFQYPDIYTPALIVVWGASLPSNADRDAIIEAEKLVREIAVKNIQEGQRDGSISTHVDVDAFSFILVGMLRGIAAELLLSPSKLNAEHLRGELLSFIRTYLENGSR